MKLIKLQDKFILVSDEEINQADNIIRLFNFEINIANDEWDNDLYKDWKKIIAGIPELPSIDFSLLSEEDCKTIGWVDVEKLANSTIDSKLKDSIKLFDIKYLKIAKYVDEAKEDLNKTIHQCLIDMFKTAQSLKDKMFSLEDMKKAIVMARKGFTCIGGSSTDTVDDGKAEDCVDWNYTEQQITQSLQQTSWDVEVEMCCNKYTQCNSNCRFDGTEQPKITNNSIKVIKNLLQHTTD